MSETSSPKIEKKPLGQEELLSILPNKLLEFQKRVTAIPKDSTNPFFKSKYFDVNTVIEIIRPILNSVGLTVTQGIGIIEGRNIIETIIRDGTSIVADSQVILPENPDPQKMGSIITYFRRYALVSLLLLQGDVDDDANLAAGGVKNPKTARIPVGTPNAVTSPNLNLQNHVGDDWDGAPKAVRPLTKKQGDLILKLQKGKGLPVTPVDVLRLFTSEEASKLIDELTK